MKNTLFFIILIFFFSCTLNDIEEITGNKNFLPKAGNDTVIKIIEPPFYLSRDSSKYIVFPVAYNNSADRKTYYSSSSDYSYYSSIYSNFVFYNQQTNQYKSISEEDLYLTGIYTNYSLSCNLVFYLIVSEDSNKDGKKDSEDFLQLAFTDSEGNNFKVITSKQEHLLSWNYYPQDNYLIIRTLSDTNNDNMVNFTNDKLNIYKINLSDLKTDNLFDENFVNKLIK